MLQSVLSRAEQQQTKQNKRQHKKELYEKNEEEVHI